MPPASYLGRAHRTATQPWWKADHVTGTMVRAEDLQRLVNQQARATTGCFRTTNLGALLMESGLRAATAQLENRRRRIALRLLRPPLEEQPQNVVDAPTEPTELGRRHTNALAYTGSTAVLVVSVPLANERLPFQGVSGMEDVIEDYVGRGAEGAREVEEPVEDPGPTCR